MKFRKNISKIILGTLLACSLGTFSSCNLFNPTQSASAAEGDAKALTYEGYLEYRNGNYSKALDFFNKAIAADSTASEAWYGKAKATINTYNINVFKLIQYANPTENSDTDELLSGFATLPDNESNNFKQAIDATTAIINEFYEREQAGKTDSVISFKQFSASFAALQMVNVALSLRETNNDILQLFRSPNGGFSVDWSVLVSDSTTESAKDILSSLSSLSSALKTDPSQSNSIVRKFVPEADTMSDTTLTLATNIVTSQIDYLSDQVNAPENEGRELVFLNVGNMKDDDGDGCIDEEIFDGIDNDGDGEIDEDMRDNGTMRVDYNDLETMAAGRLPYTLVREGYYMDIDIDGDGEIHEEDEWDTDDKKEKFIFATHLKWVFENNKKENINAKEKARLDTDMNNIKYDLEWRKKNIGGCWNNYDETRFKAWFKANAGGEK